MGRFPILSLRDGALAVNAMDASLGARLSPLARSELLERSGSTILGPCAREFELRLIRPDLIMTDADLPHVTPLTMGWQLVNMAAWSTDVSLAKLGDGRCAAEHDAGTEGLGLNGARVGVDVDVDHHAREVFDCACATLQIGLAERERLWRGGGGAAAANADLDDYLGGLMTVRWWEAPTGAFERLCEVAGTDAVKCAISSSFS